MTAPLVLISSMATRHVLAELVDAYRRESGQAVTLQAMGGVKAAEAVRDGARADVVLLASKPMADLEAEGHLGAGSLTRFARSLIALGLPENDASPVPETVAALQALLRRAGTVGYSTGPSGDRLVALWTQWGFDRDPTLVLTQAPAGVPVARLIAEGTINAGVQQLSELKNQPGVRVAGLLPEGVQLATDFVAGVASRSSQPARAQALIRWLTSPAHGSIRQRHGLL
ncbi:MAG: substrate-binding domain-containing protein [Methylobacteriaceae bacterium]|nr:substrate-binding domain-containing protein [Methylobacteriaceae bacterium]